MIKIEHNTLVLDSSHTKEDQRAVNDFIEFKIHETRRNIMKEIEVLEAQSHKTRTPLYQETIFKKLREIVYN